MILPRVWRDRDEPALREALERARSLGFTGALIGNIGHLPLVRGTGLRMYGDYGLNVFNARSLAYLRDKGLESACLSFELRSAQIRDMKKLLPAEAIVYGRLPLMITENCLIQNAAGCRLDWAGACVPENGPCRSGPRPDGPHRRGVPSAARLRPPDGDPEQPAGVSGGPAGVPAAGPFLCPAPVHHRDGGGLRGHRPQVPGRRIAGGPLHPGAL